ncbi:MAG: hypothetical protein SGJ27_14205 [Candidatus Melainabacteria bacterium]|nr:hypothetical protein [Candidatus Melainabacteria bacterium]
MTGEENGVKPGEKSNLQKPTERKSEAVALETDLKDENSQRHIEQFTKSNNSDSLSDMQLKALSAEASEHAKLAANRFELSDEASSSFSNKTNAHDDSSLMADSAPALDRGSSYVEGLQAVVENARTPEEREQKRQKFEQFYSLRKEAEHLAASASVHRGEKVSKKIDAGTDTRSSAANSVVSDKPNEVAATHKIFIQRFIKPGDTLMGIAREQLGKEASEKEVSEYVKVITRDNRISNPDKLALGTMLTMRPIERPEQVQAEEPQQSHEPEAEQQSNPVTSAADSNFDKLSEMMEKHYANSQEFNDSKLPDETRDTIGRETNREHLFEVAKKHGLEIDKSIGLIEERIARKEVSSQEIDKAYKHVERLLEAESNKGVTKPEREVLAQQILLQTANPTRIDQGNHNTCNVNSVECRIYTREPSHAARMVADLALNGEFVAADGNTVVRLNPGPVDWNGTKASVMDGLRSYASELFQVCAVNVHYVKEGKGIRYEQIKPVHGNEDDTGERLYDFSKSDPLIEKQPNLDDNALIGIYNSITGNSEDSFVFCHKSYVCGSDKELVTVSSEANLLDKLQSTPLSHYPLIFGVHTANDPFWTDSTGGTAGGAGGDSGGGHFVTVLAFKPGPPPSVVLDNQWGSKRDHVDEVTNLSVRELYFAMRPPHLAVDELDRTLTQDRNHGQRNAWRDLELQRMKAMYHLSEPKTIEMDVINVIAERLNKNSNADDWERAAGKERLEVVLSCLPKENVMRIRQEQFRVGLISDEEFREHAINCAKMIKERAAQPHDLEKLLLDMQLSDEFTDAIIDDLPETNS